MLVETGCCDLAASLPLMTALSPSNCFPFALACYGACQQARSGCKAPAFKSGQVDLVRPELVGNCCGPFFYWAAQKRAKK